MRKFEIKTWLSENREVVISKYNELSSEKFFSGISLKDFMVEILSKMSEIKSEKVAARKLSYVMGDVYMQNSTIFGSDTYDKKVSEKYNGTAYMAMV